MRIHAEMKVALREAIQKILHDFAYDDSDRGLVVHYSCSMEVVGSDGRTWLKHLASDGISDWQEAGILISALDDVRARMRQDTIDYNDEPEAE